MDFSTHLARMPGWAASTVAEAVGEERRVDAVKPVTGGPAGNARLTAWTGLVLLVLSGAELLTLVNVRGLITWHVAIGALLGPPALLKTASTGWRMIGYYRGVPAYKQAGPPPLLLRVLGPLVVLSTLGLIGTGILLVVLGEPTARTPLISLLGFRLDWVGLHQGAFVVWGAATGAHVLGRIVPAVRITLGHRFARTEHPHVVPGTLMRASLLLVAGVAAVVVATTLAGAVGSWSAPWFHYDRIRIAAQP